MTAQNTEGAGQGSAEGKLRGFDLDKIHKVLVGQMNIFKSCTELVNGKYILRTAAGDVPYDNSNNDLISTTIQNAVDEVYLNLSVAANTTLLYRPGETTEGRIFGTWTELYEYFLNTDGLINIGFDPQFIGNVTFDAGVWDMQSRAVFMAANTISFSTGIVTLVTDDDVTFKNINKITGNLLWLHQGTTNPAIKFDGTFALVTISDVAIITNFGATAPLLEVASGQDLSLVLDYGFITGQEMINFLPGANGATITLQNISEISDNPFVGSGGGVVLQISSDINNVPTDFSSYSGSVSITLTSVAENIGFNPVDTTFDLANTNVRDILNEIGGTRTYTFDSTDLNGSDVINFFHDLDKQHVFVQLINSSNQLVDINTVEVIFVDSENLQLDFTGSGHMPFTDWTLIVRK